MERSEGDRGRKRTSARAEPALCVGERRFEGQINQAMLVMEKASADGACRRGVAAGGEVFGAAAWRRFRQGWKPEGGETLGGSMRSTTAWAGYAGDAIRGCAGLKPVHVNQRETDRAASARMGRNAESPLLRAPSAK